MTESITQAHAHELLVRAQQALHTANWPVAYELFRKAVQLTPNSAGVLHNLALASYALGKHQQAIDAAMRAQHLSPTLWQSCLVMGNAYKALGDPEQAYLCFDRVLQLSPGQGEALIAKADLAMNFFGEPLQAKSYVRPLTQDPSHAVDAALTMLMASLYDRDMDAGTLNQHILAFSAKHLRLPRSDSHERPMRAGVQEGKARPRVGLISPLFNASPVYFLTIHGWRHAAKGSEIVIFNRGHKNDWATQEFRNLAHEWHDVQEMPAQLLAKTLQNAEIDVLYDLGGWMDTVGLMALSTKPASRMYKWVGGQSVTTGLDVFDGWIGDPWQSPESLQHLYSEPLINIADGYATYTPPAYFPKKHELPRLRRKEQVVFSNPAKLSRAFLAELSAKPGLKVFIHHQFRFARTRARVEKALDGHKLEFITPSTHQEALLALAQFERMADTFPYSSGLTAREAMALGLKIDARVGKLFCERHCAQIK
jgi:predicted O-linked N-acetylglucosamine transferase (SPINDLY family)